MSLAGWILVIALGTWYGLATILRVCEMTLGSLRIHQARAHARQQARALALARAGITYPSASAEDDEAWLYSHADVLLCLSPSIRGDFEDEAIKPRRITLNSRAGVLAGSVSPLQGTASAVPVEGRLEGRPQ